MAGKRGRPVEKNITPIPAEEYMSKVRRYSKEDTENKNNKPEINAKQKYSPEPVVIVFKTSNRSNAQTKMKVWTTYNIDYILSAPKIPGLPEKAEILELGVGTKLIEKYKLKYKLK